MSKISDWTDISVPLRSSMVHWPGDPPVVIERIDGEGQEDAAAVSALSLVSHSGTHIDAPSHYLPHGMSIDLMPPEMTIGKARVLEIQDRHSIKPEELIPYRIQKDERVLFKTNNSQRVWNTDEFIEDYVYITVEAAQLLAKLCIKMVGIDCLSVGGYQDDGAATHRILLKNGIGIIEGLDLSGIQPGVYELICLPLNIYGGDGAPARAIIRPLSCP
ncbi:MAG: cyclase family protein [Dehalococcoidia bacterium]